MVFGHNWQHVALFGVVLTAFFMVFSVRNSDISKPQGGIFGSQDLDLGSGWAGDRFLAKHGAQKNMILLKKWFPMGFEGDLCEGFGLYGA